MFVFPTVARVTDIYLIRSLEGDIEARRSRGRRWIGIVYIVGETLFFTAIVILTGPKTKILCRGCLVAGAATAGLYLLLTTTPAPPKCFHLGWMTMAGDCRR
jgi:hypothetical protein